MILRPFFDQYDADGRGAIDRRELGALLRDLNEPVDKADACFDPSASAEAASADLDFDEFVGGMVKYLAAAQGTAAVCGSTRLCRRTTFSRSATYAGGRVAAQPQTWPRLEREEAQRAAQELLPEVPENASALTEAEQQRWLQVRAWRKMVCGLAVILLFSQPMVDVLKSIGARTGIENFYLGFVIAPPALNAMEMFAAYTYAEKKTRASITIALQQLLAAAVMNNSFCLFIFLVWNVLLRVHRI